jgi:hypothetical protein
VLGVCGESVDEFNTRKSGWLIFESVDEVGGSLTTAFVSGRSKEESIPAKPGS